MAGVAGLDCGVDAGVMEVARVYSLPRSAFLVTNRLTFNLSLSGEEIDRLQFVWILAFGTWSSFKTSPL